MDKKKQLTEREVVDRIRDYVYQKLTLDQVVQKFEEEGYDISKRIFKNIIKLKMPNQSG